MESSADGVMVGSVNDAATAPVAYKFFAMQTFSAHFAEPRNPVMV